VHRHHAAFVFKLVGLHFLSPCSNRSRFVSRAECFQRCCLPLAASSGSRLLLVASS
jgi:hypothetical protein